MSVLSASSSPARRSRPSSPSASSGAAGRPTCPRSRRNSASRTGPSGSYSWARHGARGGMWIAPHTDRALGRRRHARARVPLFAGLGADGDSWDRPRCSSGEPPLVGSARAPRCDHERAVSELEARTGALAHERTHARVRGGLRGLGAPRGPSSAGGGAALRGLMVVAAVVVLGLAPRMVQEPEHVGAPAPGGALPAGADPPARGRGAVGLHDGGRDPRRGRPCTSSARAGGARPRGARGPSCWGSRSPSGASRGQVVAERLRE
jgi:hypothetical protein